MVREEAERRAGKILATARGHLTHHVPRDVRVAAALKTARDNIVRLDPQRLASIRALAPAHELQQKAAAARRQRVKRDLDAARATCARLADMRTPPRRPARSEIIHKTENGARRPEAPSPVPRLREEAPPPSADPIESLSYRFEILREAVGEAMGEMVGELQAEYRRRFEAMEREDKLLRREIDLLQRELAMLRKGMAA